MAAKEESGFFEDWPQWSKPIMALAAMALLGGAWIGVPLLVTTRLMEQVAAGGVVNYQPLSAALLATTTATITGIFLFMTLRIDRGTRLKAEKVAREAVEDEIKVAHKRLGEIEDAVASIRGRAEAAIGTFLEERFNEGTASKTVRQEVERRLTDEVLEGHVKAILVTNANVDVIREYAKKQAAMLDAETVERILRILEEVVESLQTHVPTKRSRERGGVFGRLFGRSNRSSTKRR